MNVSQELESETRTKPGVYGGRGGSRAWLAGRAPTSPPVPAPLSSQEVGDEEEEGLPDYENLQELN